MANRSAAVIKALRTGTRCFAMLSACFCATLAQAGESGINAAAALRAKYVQLQGQLAQNQFQRPLYMDSIETSSHITGDIYALLDHPFATAGAALNGPGNWCEILILHINTKYCRASSNNAGTVLQVNIGKKHDQPLSEAYRVNFDYRVAAETPTYLKVMLHAGEGPFSTRDYRVALEATPIDNGKTFMRLTYSYGYGFAGRVAMQAYLGTIGSGKVGFTVVSKQSDGKPVHIGGMRGLVERNTMRYYLAIESFLGAHSLPPQARIEKSLHDWFTAIERYPRQLHELTQSEYIAMKRKEYLRQQAEKPATRTALGN